VPDFYTSNDWRLAVKNRIGSIIPFRNTRQIYLGLGPQDSTEPKSGLVPRKHPPLEENLPQDEVTPLATGPRRGCVGSRAHGGTGTTKQIIKRVVYMISYYVGGQARSGRLSIRHIVLPLAFVGLLLGCSEEKPKDRSMTGNMSSSTVAPPPAIVASHSYRCSDDQVIYIDFLANDLSIIIRKSPTGPMLRLSAYAQGVSYVGDDGTNLTLDGKDIKLDEPTREPVTCKRL